MMATGNARIPKKTISPGRSAKMRASAYALPFQPQQNPMKSAFLDDTVAFWQPLSTHTLNREDAREIVENMTGFFTVLREWAEADLRATRSVAGVQNNGPKISVAVDSADRQTPAE
jgi:hypothetical protein